MNHDSVFRLVFGVFLIAATLLMFASGLPDASASNAYQETPPPEITIMPAITEVIPDTGGDQTFFLPGWAILALVGVVLLILLVALVVRAGTPATVTHHHHDTHDHTP